jgi:hypothetical protein
MPDNALQILHRELDPGEYYGGEPLEGVDHITQEFVDHSRWYVTYLDIYYHAETDTYGGVISTVGATEMQECDDPAEVVEVERDPTPRFRLRR